MDDNQWRRHAEAAVAELSDMGFDPPTEAQVRRELMDALAADPSQAKSAIRSVLTSRPTLREWLRLRIGDDPVRAARPAEPGIAPPAPQGDGSYQPGQTSRRVDLDSPIARVGRVPGGYRGGSHSIGGAPFGGVAEPAPTRRVYPRLDAPASVVVETPFLLVVGLAAAPAGDVLAVGFDVPVGPLTLTVSLLLDGFRTVDGSSTVRILVGSDDVPYPTTAIDLVAVDDPAYRTSRSILAVFTVDGHQLGVATRTVEVGATRGVAPRATSALPLPVVWVVPTEAAPDLQITVARGNDRDGRTLQWTAQSPHPEVVVPAEPVLRTMDGQAAGDFAQRFMRGVEQRRSADDLGTFLRGVQLMVGEQVPKEIWAALTSAAHVVDRPAVLFASADAFIPWELASVPRPWAPDWPPLLGTQTRFGRWIYDENSDVAAPAPTIVADDIAVVKGIYSGGARLLEAEAEADHLVAAYQAQEIPAEVAAVLKCLRGDPSFDIVHFAVHGKLDVSGYKDGIVMNDQSTLDFVSIRGVETGQFRLVFLNACQVGQGQEALGSPAGVVSSFIRIGAQAVIAPLWKVDDMAAREFAERFYAAVLAGREVSEVLAEERALAFAAGAGDSPESTALAYLFFGHPRLTITRR